MRARSWAWLMLCSLLSAPVLAQAPVHTKRFLSGWSLSEGAALVVPSHGRPLLGVHRERNGVRELAWYHCADPECGRGDVNTFTSGPSSALLTGFSIAVSANDVPIAVHISDSNLYFSQCSDAFCSSVLNAMLLARDAASVRLAVNSAGAAVIVYAASSGRLRLVNCADVRCETRTFVDLPGRVAGANFALALTANDEPRVIYRREATSAWELGMVFCGGALCVAPTECGAPAGINGVGPLRLAIGRPNDRVYFATTHWNPLPHGFGSTSVIVNEWVDCGALVSAVALSPIAGMVGMFPVASLTIGLDGLPLAAFYSGNSDRSMYVVHGRPRDFGSDAGHRTVADHDVDARGVSVGVRPDGRPVLAYSAGTQGFFVLSCNTRTCS